MHWPPPMALPRATAPAAPAGPKTILGLDPGSQRTGYGIIDCDGPEYRCVVQGRIDVAGASFVERLHRIHDGVRALLARHAPDEIAVEKVFVNVNPQSTLLLGQARGTAICAAVIADLPVAEYTALQVKQAVVGNGHARKEQVQEMVKRLLGLPGYPSADAADALACAICHAHGGQGWRSVAASGVAARVRGTGVSMRVRGGRLL